MTAQPGTRVKWSESKRLGFGSFDDLPDVDPHAVGHHLHFVDQSDIDGAVNVFEQLTELSDLGRRDWDDFRIDGAVHGETGLQAGGGGASDYFGDGSSLKVRVSGIFALRAEHDMDILADNESAGPDPGQHLLRGGARIGR